MRAAQAAPPPAPPSPANASDVALSGQGGARDGGGVVKAQPTPPAQADKDERGRRQRISAATRDAVETRIGPRVEKLRHASNVVLEEASYDPSLRFVLIAVAIFLASMLLLLLNHILG